MADKMDVAVTVLVKNNVVDGKFIEGGVELARVLADSFEDPDDLAMGPRKEKRELAGFPMVYRTKDDGFRRDYGHINASNLSSSRRMARRSFSVASSYPSK